MGRWKECDFPVIYWYTASICVMINEASFNHVCVMIWMKDSSVTFHFHLSKSLVLSFSFKIQLSWFPLLSCNVSPIGVAVWPTASKWSLPHGTASCFAIKTDMEATLHVCHVQCPLNRALTWGSANVFFSVYRGTPAAVRSGIKGAT